MEVQNAAIALAEAVCYSQNTRSVTEKQKADNIEIAGKIILCIPEMDIDTLIEDAIEKAIAYEDNYRTAYLYQMPKTDAEAQSRKDSDKQVVNAAMKLIWVSFNQPLSTKLRQRMLNTIEKIG